jgi:hypothetical protein
MIDSRTASTTLGGAWTHSSRHERMARSDRLPAEPPAAAVDEAVTDSHINHKQCNGGRPYSVDRSADGTPDAEDDEYLQEHLDCSGERGVLAVELGAFLLAHPREPSAGEGVEPDNPCDEEDEHHDSVSSHGWFPRSLGSSLGGARRPDFGSRVSDVFTLARSRPRFRRRG